MHECTPNRALPPIVSQWDLARVYLTAALLAALVGRNLAVKLESSRDAGVEALKRTVRRFGEPTHKSKRGRVSIKGFQELSAGHQRKRLERRDVVPGHIHIRNQHSLVAE